MARHQEPDNRQSKFFSLRHGWVDKLTDDTKIKMDSVARKSWDVIVENQLWVPNPRGGWAEVPASSEAQLGPVERGLIFQQRSRRTPEGHFVEFTSLRYLDPHMVDTLFEGLATFDFDLKPLANPTLAINHFCLGNRDAELFMNRVQSIGGQIAEAHVDLAGMERLVLRLSEIGRAMGQMCEESRAIIDQIRDQGIKTEAQSISDRVRDAARLRSEAVELRKEIQSEYTALEDSEDRVAAQGKGYAFVQAAEQWIQHIDMLHAEHRQYEVQAIELIKKDVHVTGPDSSTVSRRYLLMDVVEYYTRMGFDARMIDGGMVLRIDDHVVELTDQPRVITPDTQASAEAVKGRNTHRTQREL